MFADTYSDLALSFNSWCDSSPTGGEYVSLLPLEYANRAQDALWSDPPQGWDYLTKTAKLTLSGLTASLPSEFGMMLNVYTDSDGDGKPDRYYFKDGKLLEGFKFSDAFAKDTGHSFSITFYQSPESDVYCDYQVKLDPFAGTDTEYLFFPKNLMLRKMQHLRCLDKGMLKEWEVFDKDYQRELDLFKGQHQNSAEAVGIQVNDYRGSEVFLPKYRITTGGAGRGKIVGSTNDQDIYRR